MNVAEINRMACMSSFQSAIGTAGAVGGSERDARTAEIGRLKARDNQTNFYHLGFAYLVMAATIAATIALFAAIEHAGLSWLWTLPVTFVAIVLMGAIDKSIVAWTRLNSRDRTRFITRFDSMRLDLRMNMKDRDVKASIRRFVAGNLQVGGGLLIKPDDGLSGRLTTTLAAGERRVSLPVVVSGTLGAPALRLAPEAVR